jgi:drug/metabolite transporter (DMT)-like permease
VNDQTGNSQTAAARPPAILAGIGMMALGIWLFVVNDVLGKWLVATYSVGQVLLIRSLAAVILLVPMIWPMLRREGLAPFLNVHRRVLQMARIVCSTLEVACFYWAVTDLPLANVICFYLAGPIFVTALSVPLLGEKVDLKRWLLVISGFAGVLVAMQPTSGEFGFGGMIALLGSFTFALMIILSRMLRGTPDLVLVSGQTIGALVFGIFAAPFAWIDPGLLDGALLALLGVVAAIAHLCVNRSLKLAPAAVVSPYLYTQIIWGVLFGYIIFGDIPDLALAIGCVMIVASGLALLMLERKTDV